MAIKYTEDFKQEAVWNEVSSGLKAVAVIMLHPKIAEMYQKQVAELTTAFTTDDETRMKTHLSSAVLLIR